MSASCTSMVATAVLLVVSASAAAADSASVSLIVPAGRPLRVVLDHRVVVRRAGQEISGTVIEPLYAYDRVVVPVGTKVLGRVARIEPAPRGARVRAMLGGDFSPLSHPVFEFDRLVFEDGREVPIRTSVTGAVDNITLDVAASTEKTGIVSQAKEAAARKVHETIGTITRPGKKERLEDALIRRLPYHRPLLSRGTILNAGLRSPIEFGVVAAARRAPAGAVPAPESILDARLVTSLDSSKTPRGTHIAAIVAQPVFSADRELILPEGAELQGEVTLAREARRFHRNGQLRFLFESVDLPDRPGAPLLASLSSIETSADDRVAVDDEGGATITNSKTRFIAPALAMIALRGTLRHRHFMDHDGDANDVAGGVTTQGSAGARAFGGFFGLGLLGIGVAQISHPVGIALAAVGTVRTAYSAVFAKGREVSFPADTPIQVQLAPGAARADHPQ